MNIKIPVIDGLKLKWVGITDFEELYRKMKFYLVDHRGFATQEGLEKKYIERVKGEGSKDMEILWIADKKKPNEFFKYVVRVEFRVLGMSKIEVPQGDIKRKMNKGTFEMKIFASLESTDAWESLKGFQKMYQRMIMNRRIEDFLEDLYSKTMDLHSLAKSFLGLR
ncbi:hypothetical protein J4425_00530 [Candidatus Woesearchaeota archaeon]|nr:hypothetical protein [uncultured archaeon]AQS33997.1 hypothetical protein [uncultured archaeon]MBS3150280.1 hypothetical protein [Candidatus Woesearchaeota archaeon]